MLEQAYDSVSIAGKMPFTEENLQKVLDEYSSGQDNLYKVTYCHNAVCIACPTDPFGLINQVDTRLDGHRTGYKFIDGSLIIPL